MSEKSHFSNAWNPSYAKVVANDNRTRLLMHGMRWRKSISGYPSGYVIIIVIFIHGMFILGVRSDMNKPATEISKERYLTVRLIDQDDITSPPGMPALPKLNLKPSVDKKHLGGSATSDPSSRISRASGLEQLAHKTPWLHLFARDDSFVLTPQSNRRNHAVPVPDYIQRRPQANTDVMQRSTNLGHDSAEGGDEQFGSESGSLGESAVRSTERTSTFRLGRLNIHCSTVLFIIPVGCVGDPPPKPSPLSGDPRLNLPPATPLVSGLNSAPKETNEARRQVHQ